MYIINLNTNKQLVLITVIIVHDTRINKQMRNRIICSFAGVERLLNGPESNPNIIISNNDLY